MPTWKGKQVWTRGSSFPVSYQKLVKLGTTPVPILEGEEAERGRIPHQKLQSMNGHRQEKQNKTKQGAQSIAVERPAGFLS